MNEGGGLTAWLTAAGAPEAMAARIGQELGTEADERVTADPWCVLEVPGVAPQAADALARVVLDTAEPTDPRRTRALVSWLLRRAAAGGSTVQGADVIAEALGKLGAADATGAIADAIEHGAALAFAEPISLSEDADEEEIEDFERQDAEDDDDPASMLTSARTLLALERWAFAEQAAAEAAQRLAATPEAVEAKQDTDSTDALVGAVVEHGLTLVTGAGAERLAELVAAFPAALLATPSAAGLRTLAAAGAEALDARRLAEEPGRIGAADVIVIADAQLIGVELGATLLESARDGAHVVLAGDPATVPGTGAGLLFRDLLEIDDLEFGGRLPRVELKRRPTGPLSSLSDAVRYGGLPPQELLAGPDGTSKEVVIVPVREAGEAVHRAVQVAADSIPRAFGLSGQQVQVVAVDAESAAGTGALNAALKQRCNPGPGVCGGFDAGDRVVVAAALSDRGLLGGETGTIGRADAESLTVTWDPPHRAGDALGAVGTVEAAGAPGAVAPADVTQTDAEREAAEVDEAEAEAAEGAPESGASSASAVTADVARAEHGADDGSADTFTAAEARALRHAWALTVSEAQGGRWPAVVAVFDGESAPKLSRALVLGAITLATQHLTVVHGAGRALSEAVEKIPDRPRRTRLKHALRE
jgi:ATP-dependent exoDNAse (exonuclease V) alpha subunit